VRGLLVVLLIAAASPVEARPYPRPTWQWTLSQLAPSPGLAVGVDQASLDLRWQLTPLLYSWGVNRRVSSWRAFVVDPFARHSGSIELFVDPELLFAHRLEATLRPGIRAYIPLRERGELLSASLGISDQRFDDRNVMAIEAGIYALYGTFGLQLTYAPNPITPARVILTLSLRYF
jgi:hypothetical protein